jgi:uncharacterized protein
MTTNGMLLAKHIDFLVSNDFNLLISLDGNRSNDSYRVDKAGNPTFDMVVKNINIVQSKYPQYFENRVHFNSVLTNRATVEDIHNYIYSTFGKIPLIDPISSTDIEDSKFDSFRNISQKYVETADLTEKRGSISIMGKELSRFFYYNLNNSYHHYLDIMASVDRTMFTRIPSGTCLPFGTKIYITSEGEIMVCEKIAFGHTMGYVNKYGVNIDFDVIVDNYNRYYDSLRPQCRSCFQVYTCPLCIFQEKFIDGLPRCPHLITEENYKRYLSTIVSILEENPRLFFEFNKVVYS